MAESYEEIYRNEAWFGSRESHLLERYAQVIPDRARVLDVGMGQGRNALPLARNGCRVTGLDTSSRAISAVQDMTLKENLDLESLHLGFLDYHPNEAFDVVLCFGLLQVLSPQDAASLIDRLNRWTKPQGVLIMTAWTEDDPSFSQMCEDWKRLGLRAFQSPDGACYRFFLGAGELRQLFLRWDVEHYWEGLGQPHNHGDGPIERHGEVESVFIKPAFYSS